MKTRPRPRGKTQRQAKREQRRAYAESAAEHPPDKNNVDRLTLARLRSRNRRIPPETAARLARIVEDTAAGLIRWDGRQLKDDVTQEAQLRLLRRVGTDFDDDETLAKQIIGCVLDARRFISNQRKRDRQNIRDGIDLKKITGRHYTSRPHDELIATRYTDTIRLAIAAGVAEDWTDPIGHHHARLAVADLIELHRLTRGMPAVSETDTE